MRGFTKWDYQPGSIHGVPDSFARAYSIMMSEPQGPVLHGLRLRRCRKAPLTEDDGGAHMLPSKFRRGLRPNRQSSKHAADMLVAARESTVADRICRAHAQWASSSTVELAETVGAVGLRHQQAARFSQPPSAERELSRRRLQRRRSWWRHSTCVDWTRGSHKLNTQTREVSVVTAPDCKWIDVGFADIEISKWATDYNKHHNWDHRVLGDSALTTPGADRRVPQTASTAINRCATTIDERKKAIGERHARQWQKWQDQVERRVERAADDRVAPGARSLASRSRTTTGC